MNIEYHPPDFIGNTFDLGDRIGRLAFSLRRPRVAVVEDFLDDEECEALIESAADRLAPATVHNRDGSTQLSSYRSSWNAKIERSKNAIIGRIETRAAKLAATPDSHGELIEVIRYRQGQQYRPHCDWFDQQSTGGKARIAEFGQRIATVIMYLNDGFVGGSTFFSRIGLDVRPRKGAALYFSNLDESGQGDWRTLHEGEPVLEGEKMIATRWFSSQPQKNLRPDASSPHAEAGNGVM